jgi:hypothetical protein
VLKSKINNKKGLTLFELLTTLVITIVLISTISFTYKKINEKSKEELSIIEAQAVANLALKQAGFKNRKSLLTADFVDSDLDYIAPELQLAENRMSFDPNKGQYWLFTSSYKIDLLIYTDGSVEISKKIENINNENKESAVYNNPPSVSNLNAYCIPQQLNLCTEQDGLQAVYLNWQSINQSSYSITTIPLTSRGNISSTSNIDNEAYLGMASEGVEYTIIIKVFSNNNLSGPSSTSTIRYTPKKTKTLLFDRNLSAYITDLGIFKDTINNTTLQKTTQKTNLRFLSENWKKISIEYNNSIFDLGLDDEKNMSRYLYKINENQVDININSSIEYILKIEYNNSNVYTYIFN